MWIYMSHNATVEENEIYNSYGNEVGPLCGIFVEWSNDTSLLNNVLGDNAEMGVSLLNSHDGEIIGNTIFESYVLGLYVIIASGWDISHNVIYDCGDPGIILETTSHDNLVYYNDIGWCGGIQVGDGGTDNSWNYTGVGNWYSDYSGTGPYSIDGPAGAVDYYPSVSLYCGVTTPSQYEAGTTGNTMTWNSSALNPGTYELLINGTSQGHVDWDGNSIAADVDGLPVGVYNVTLIVYHVSGHWLANQSILTVVDTMAPTWTLAPEDQTLEYNEALSYQLQATDGSGIASWAVNDTTNFAISGSGLLTNATFLEPGVYYVEITVTDVYSHSVSVTLMITVNEPVPPPFDPTMVVLAIGGAGAVVLVIIGVIVFKKKKT
jgi:parallel beta-helix repeat protein